MKTKFIEVFRFQNEKNTLLLFLVKNNSITKYQLRLFSWTWQPCALSAFFHFAKLDF